MYRLYPSCDGTPHVFEIPYMLFQTRVECIYMYIHVHMYMHEHCAYTINVHVHVHVHGHIVSVGGAVHLP